MVSSLKEGPSLYLQEYSIIDDKDVEKKRVHPDEGIRVDVIEGKKIFWWSYYIKKKKKKTNKTKKTTL